MKECGEKDVLVRQSLNTKATITDLDERLVFKSQPLFPAFKRALNNKAAKEEIAKNLAPMVVSLSMKNFPSQNIGALSAVPEEETPEDLIFPESLENTEDSIEIFHVSFDTETEASAFSGEYLSEIYSNLLLEEKNAALRPVPNYTDSQPFITCNNRAVLVDWMVEGHLFFNLAPDTLFKSIMILDTFLSSNNQIIKDKFQLLGVTALFIASKFNEIYCPKIKDFIMLTGNSYTSDELLDMEKRVLTCLDFNVLSPTSSDFFNILAKVFKFNKKQYFLGYYFLENSLIDDRLLSYLPSEIACACAYIVMKFFNMPEYRSLYDERLLLSDFPQEVIKEAAREICFLTKDVSNSSLQMLKRKYSMPYFEQVAVMAEN